MRKQKNLFCSLTFWGILLSYFNHILPAVREIVMQSDFSLTIALDLFESSLLFVMAIVGRYNANAVVYTSKNLPGRNRQSTYGDMDHV